MDERPLGLAARITEGMFSRVSGSRVQRFRVKIMNA
jgi:hypothetical protein